MSKASDYASKVSGEMPSFRIKGIFFDDEYAHIVRNGNLVIEGCELEADHALALRDFITEWFEEKPAQTLQSPPGVRSGSEGTAK